MSKTITHEGIVRAHADEHVRVEIVQKAACAACKAKSMCTASETMVKEIIAEPIGTLEIGDNVMVSVEQKLGWQAVWWSFMLPASLILLIISLLPHWIASEAIVGTIALGFLLPYYGVLHLFSKRFERKYRFMAYKIDEITNTK